MRWSLLVACFLALPAAAEIQLTPDAQAKLGANGFLVVDEPLKQGFSAYVDQQRPVFITSDSILMAYHRVFEEYCARENIAKMTGLMKCLPELWRRLPAKPLSAKPEDREGFRRARLVVATAWRLLSGEFPAGLSDEERKEVLAEVKLVETGTGTQGPSWLSSTLSESEYVNYHAFDPGSFGEGVALLGRYHRCRKWLQEMKVDSFDDTLHSMAEHIAFALVGIEAETASAFTGGEQDMEEEERGLFQPLSGETGEPIAREFSAEWREEFAGRLKEPRFARLLPTAVPYGSFTARKLLEMGSPQRTPEAVGAALGNPVALASLDIPLKKWGESPDSGWATYYVGALMKLNAPADARSPDLLRSEAWARKQLNATLGSWTEYRYALQLASRNDGLLAGSSREQGGFVEPVPSFYGALGEAAEALAANQAADVGLKAVAGDAIAIRLAIWLESLKQAGTRKPGDPEEGAPSFRTIDHDLVHRLFPKTGELAVLGWSLYMPGECKELAALIDAFLAKYWKGEAAAVAKLQRETLHDSRDPGPKLWQIATTCYRLQALAERQLAAQAWTKDDEWFLKSYGSRLAEIMFYQGNSYLSPLDDAPRIVRFGSVENPPAVRVFHAATARPRLLLIRYPDHEGKEILCQGAVYAYRDEECEKTPALKKWQAEAEKSAWPVWMSPIVGSYDPPEGR